MERDEKVRFKSSSLPSNSSQAQPASTSAPERADETVVVEVERRKSTRSTAGKFSYARFQASGV